MVGVLALLMFMMAGLAVDMGNAWARGRTVQKQVDVSAISVGYRLPMGPVAGHTRDEVVADLAGRMVSNAVLGQSDTFDNTRDRASLVTALTADLKNGDPSDGDVKFYKTRSDATNGTPECTEALGPCPVMVVVAPEAEVRFGFAGAFEGVGGSTTVQRRATVEVRTSVPRNEDMLPFWLPSGCGYGPTHADTTQGGKAGPVVPSTWTLPRAANNGPEDPAPLTLLGPDDSFVYAGSTTKLKGFSVSGVPRQYNKVSLRATAPDGTFVDFVALASGDGALPEISLGPSDVTGKVGAWRVVAMAQQNQQHVITSTNYKTIKVEGQPVTPTPDPVPDPDPATDPPTTPSDPATTAPPGVESGCVGQDRGNFGQLDSPRATGHKNDDFLLNVALGLDHRLAAYTFPANVAETKDCGSASSPLLGAVFDNNEAGPGDGANCIIGDPGNDGPKAFQGLVEGTSSHPGRLDTDNGRTVCEDRNDVEVGTKSINNDYLQCFLRGSGSLASISSDDTADRTMLDPAIKKSPRFVYLPVVYPSDRAQKGFQPIRSFVPGFITEETLTKPISGVTSEINGVEMQGNSFKTLHVFTFSPRALPLDESDESVSYDPASGDKIVRLVG
ncbi:hypothetical protein ASG49_12120 [Marmoricola sp. Leaf446]|nr:hypothetical protein ASG49_12120 [Marmoricola sp. Leaf446]